VGRGGGAGLNLGLDGCSGGVRRCLCCPSGEWWAC